MASSAGNGASSGQAGSSVVSSQDFVVRIPKSTKRRFHVMRFLQGRQQTVSDWTQVRMERENNMREYRNEADELPKHGAGSEYGRDLKEEARRKKFGIVRKKYNPDDQPWVLNVGGKHGRRFRGVREGGVMANASYYVFSKAPDGIFEAYPVDEWYNFTPVQRFKALTAEEAEDAFSQRDRVINHFAIMINKRIAEAQGQTVEPEKEEKTTTKKSRASLKLSDMDDWVGDSDLSAGSDEEEDTDRKKKKRKNEKKKDKKNQESGEESAKEESDEGDFDDREVDYMTSGSDSSDQEPEDAKANKQLKGVEDEDALRQLVLSDEEEEDEETKKEEGEEDKKAEDEKNAASKDGANKDEKEKKSKSSDESSSESSESDLEDSKFGSAVFMGKKKDGNGSRSGTPTKEVNGKKSKAAAGKRKKESTPTKDGANQPGASANASDTPVSKKPKIELNLGGSSASNTPTASSAQQNTPLSQVDGVSEEAIKRYLMRKPMTTTELLQKFRAKKTGLTSDQLVTVIAEILKRMNTEKQRVNGKLYLSMKQR